MKGISEHMRAFVSRLSPEDQEKVKKQAEDIRAIAKQGGDLGEMALVIAAGEVLDPNETR